MVATNQKSVIDTQKGKRNPNITLKIAIKSQERKTKERNKKDLQKQYDNKNVHINDYFKCKWTKCFNRKTQGWLNGYKNKTSIYVAYKRLTSDLRTLTD